MTLWTNIRIVTAKDFPGKKLKEYVLRVMDEEEEEIKRDINNITCNIPFKSPVIKNLQRKYANWPFERQLATGIQKKW